MTSRYKFSEEGINAIKQAHKENKDKRAEARLKALELRARGRKASEEEIAASKKINTRIEELKKVFHKDGCARVSPVTIYGSTAMSMEQ